jgi:hypothetical protein
VRLTVRFVRAGVGTVLLLLAAPLMLAGGGLRVVLDHRAADGTLSARVEPLHVAGRAAVVTDLDSLLRTEAPFARGGQTTLSISGRGPGGPLFFGIAPRADVERYLAGVRLTRVDRVRLARGPLPVDTTAVLGSRAPAVPTKQPFWRTSSVEAPLTWSPSALRGQHLSLVVMNADGSAGIDVDLLASLRPSWLATTSTGLLILSGAVVVLAFLVLAWPQAQRASGSDPTKARPAVGPGTVAEEPSAAERTLPPLPPIKLRFLWPAAPAESPEISPAKEPVLASMRDESDI